MTNSGKKSFALIGCGYWGPNYIRVLQQFPEADLVLICDADVNRIRALEAQFPNYKFCTSSKEVFGRSDIDAVIISTPVESHFPLVKEALASGKDVLCEKPLSLRAVEVGELYALAKANGRIILTGHIYLFHSVVSKLKEIINDKETSRIHYLTDIRTNLGPIRSDTNVIGDLAAHDISILYYLLNTEPKLATASGGIYIQPNIHDVAFITLHFPQNIIANLSLSWLAPKKQRLFTVVSENKMITWDDLDILEPIRIYDKSARHDVHYKDYKEFHAVSLREGNVVIPKVAQQEPLKAEVAYFISCMKNRTIDMFHENTAMVVAKTIQAIEESIKQYGAPVAILP